MVSDSFSETLGRLLMGTGNDSSGNRSELREGVPRVGGEFHANPPSDDEYAELDAAVGEMDRTLLLFGAEQEVRRMAIRLMVDFWGRRQSTRQERLVEQAPSVAPLQMNHGATYEGGNFGVTGGVYSNDGWTGGSGEANGNGPFSISGGVCGNGLVNVLRQKRPAHRQRSPRVADRKAQVVERFSQLIATNPKVAAAHQQLVHEFDISLSYVKQILRVARKNGAL